MVACVRGRAGIMVFKATFNNISVIWWRSVLLVDETGEREKKNDQPQVTDKPYRIMVYRAHLAMSGIPIQSFRGDRH